ncbi:MAG: hypothetical protein ACJ74G_07080 [Blastocatellia bacterium]
MAASTINTECKRYGCMKNLLACFANCRYVGRCDELRNELSDKTAQAEDDINRYLSERGRNPVLVQLLKRGVKFDDKAARLSRKPVAQAKTKTVAAKISLTPKNSATPGPRPTRRTKPAASEARPTRQVMALPVTAAMTSPRATLRLPAVAPRPAGESRTRKRSKMPKRVKPALKVKAASSESLAATSPATPVITSKPETTPRPTGKRAAPRRQAAAKSRKGGNGKVYIIIEGQTASIVDEQGLMTHLFSNRSKNARYFEASEVEARLQIVLKR